MQWFYTINGKKEGPVEYSEIQNLISDGTITPDDYLWNQTMGEQWSQVSSLPEFSDTNPTPPLPSIINTEYTQPIMPQTHIRPDHLDGNISCTAPVRPAWERMKDILFRPFNMRKWFILGVSAWLATLGKGGSGSTSSNARDLGGSDEINHDSFAQGIAYIHNFWSTYSNYIIIGAIALTIIIIGISLLVGWLKAHGKFMLLDNVINNSAEINAPWIEFTQHSRSLFLWYICFSVVNMLVFLIIGGIGILSIAIPCIKASTFAPAAIPGIVAVSTVTLIYIIAAAYIGRFVEDFIIPLMYNLDMTITEAWHKFKEIYSENSSSFIVYGLFYLVLTFASSIAIVTFAIATCCIGGCLMMIPFVGTVVLLPVTIFFRAYSVEYLAQFGEDFICFPDEK